MVNDEIKTRKEGDIVKLKITSIVPHGVFCDFVEKEGYKSYEDYTKYVYISKIVSRGFVPSLEAFRDLINQNFPNAEINVKIEKIDETTKPKRINCNYIAVEDNHKIEYVQSGRLLRN
jgi:predicted RNA-binding protein with RPS1 domain